MIKKLLTLLLVLLANPLWAQTSQRSTTLTYAYDLTSASYIYCSYWGKNNDPWQVGGGIPSPSVVETVGSSATVTASTAATNPFAQVAVGDILAFRLPATGATERRRVIARASADEVTVNAVIDLGTVGVPFEFYTQKCGTAATDGWLDVSLFNELTFSWNVATFNATSIDGQTECRVDSASSPVVLNTKNVTAVGSNSYTITSGAWSSCRFGLKINTDTGAQSITTTLGYKRTGPNVDLVMKEASMTVTAAELLALDVTPKVLLPASVGVGYMPWAISVYKPAGTAYANILAGDDLVFQTTTGTNYFAVETIGLLDQATVQGVVMRFGAGTVNTALLDVGLQLRLLGPIDTGDSPLVVKVVYWESNLATP